MTEIKNDLAGVRVVLVAANRFQQHLDGATGTVVSNGQRGAIVHLDERDANVIWPVSGLAAE